MTRLTYVSGAPTDGAKGRSPDQTRALKKNRVQFDFMPRSLESLNMLKAKTEASSYADVVRNALRLYEALIEETERGNQFLVRDKGGVVSTFRLFL